MEKGLTVYYDVFACVVLRLPDHLVYQLWCTTPCLHNAKYADVYTYKVLPYLALCGFHYMKRFFYKANITSFEDMKFIRFEEDWVQPTYAITHGIRDEDEWGERISYELHHLTSSFHGVKASLFVGDFVCALDSGTLFDGEFNLEFSFFGDGALRLDNCITIKLSPANFALSGPFIVLRDKSHREAVTL